MFKQKALAAFVASALILSTGCANKAQTGTLVGAGIGGVACNLLTKNSSNMTRLLATAGCAAVGGLLGNKIGSMLDERDQLALAQKKEMVLASAAPGTKFDWNSGHSGATATLETTKQYTQTKPVQVKRVATVQAPPKDLELLGKPYVTTASSSNVRAAPSKTAEKVGGMTQGTEFNAIGKTGEWILVGRKGVNVGYIHNSLVAEKGATKAAVKSDFEVVDVTKPETKAFAVTQAEAVAVQTGKPVAQVQKEIVVAEAQKPQAQQITQPEIVVAENVVAENVQASTTCKEISVSVTAGGKSESDKSTHCQTGSGFEEIVL
ncbi:SH3 domain-containing protein [Pseudomonas sp. R-28-1W-6]|uniref:SH3 domain-containing protein n=1 Tax=Pseudomonas sp. R-28-1W-6 TaxID=2650101 RepID=UPI0013664609|nr:SH3 domain-containing protein [Pseudomonas sp. R-28-1W-6]